MHDSSDLKSVAQASGTKLLGSTLLAVVVAGALLVIAVLPAEYGIDPTGVGEKLGLTALHEPVAENAKVEQKTDVTEGSKTPLNKQSEKWRSDSKTVTLQPNRGAELKAVMKAGERMLFNWEVKGGSVSFDMHSQLADAGEDDFTSFWLGEDQSTASGSFEAPFDGHHGWYWQNDGDAPVDVVLTTSGFYSDLYMP